MASLTDFFTPQFTPAPGYQSTLTLADLALQGSGALAGTRLEQGIQTRNFRTRTIPAIVDRAAARGSFYGGGTTTDLGQAGENAQDNVGRMEFNLQQQMQDIVRRSYMASLGLQL